MGVFRTFVCSIIMMITMFFLWTQSTSLSPFLLVDFENTGFHMGYPIMPSNNNNNNNSNYDLEDDDEEEEEEKESNNTLLIETTTSPTKSARNVQFINQQLRVNIINRSEAGIIITETNDNAVEQTNLSASIDNKSNRAAISSSHDSSKTIPKTPSSASCWPPALDRNSNDDWWNKTRIGNHITDTHDPRLVDADYLYDALLDPWSANVVNQTVCHDQSRFLDPTPSHLSDHDWHVRLMYLGLYLHQHLPAMKDIAARRSCQSQDNNNNNKHHHNNNKTWFHHHHHHHHHHGDYQCDPQTKYLVVSLPAKGAGATFRAGAVPALLAGLATNRVVIFANKLAFGDKQMRSYWHLASLQHCPRGDIQCYFLPSTPCVLTEDELRNATNIPQASAVEVLAEGKAGKGFKPYRILVINAKSAPLPLFETGERRMRARIYKLVKDVAHKYHVPAHVLEQIRDRIEDRQHPQPQPQQQSPSDKKNTTIPNTSNPSSDRFGHYNRARSTLHHAALLYLLRPHVEFRKELDQVVQKAIPPDFDPQWSFGIPIRASDKCALESTCLTFQQYMQLAMQQYHTYSNGTTTPTTTTTTNNNNNNKKVANLVLTSEAASMMALRHNYTTSAEFPFRFVVNVDDVTQGSGTPRRYRSKDAHKVMLSTMAALKLQLLPKYNVANCCSSFHQVLLDLLRSGCGAVHVPDFRCLQETDDPQFHVCCQWNHDDRCEKTRDEFVKLYQNNHKAFA